VLSDTNAIDPADGKSNIFTPFGNIPCRFLANARRLARG
jgi:hypothetical protein